MTPKDSSQLRREIFVSQTSLAFPIFCCVDPDAYSEFGSGSTMLRNADLIWSTGLTLKVMPEWSMMPW